MAVESDAAPPLRDALPRDVVPSKNCTVPVAVAGDTVALNLTLVPKVDGLRLEVRVVVVPAGLTVWASEVEVLPLKVASPPYTAVIECAPPARLAVERVATPAALSADEPRVVVPSLKLTPPVGVPVPEEDVTVAVNVTDWPYVEGFKDETSVVALAAKACPQDENLKEPMRVFQLPAWLTA